MSYRRFRTDGGTHRGHFEQMTSGENLDCAIAFRRLKLAKNDILLAAFGEWPKSKPGARKTRQVGPATGDLEQTTSHGDEANTVGIVSRNRDTFMFGSSPSEVTRRIYARWKKQRRKL